MTHSGFVSEESCDGHRENWPLALQVLDEARRILAGVATLTGRETGLVEREGDRWRITGLLDPDVQFADVEYELAYLEVFDASRDTFFAAYQQHHPLPY